MDNEASTVLKRMFQKIITVVQLYSPHFHRRNTAERAIHTFKKNVVGLASVENSFSIYMWCLIVKQAEITMNLLQTSITNPRLSVYVQTFVTYDLNSTSMAPPGTKIIAH